MASSPTTRNRLEKQGAGENNNTWGAPKLNTLIDLVDSSLDGWTTISASGATTLSSTNYAADQSRMRVLNVTASATATLTIPGVEKWYIVRAVSADVIITTGGATTATVKAGNREIVICDGAACYLGRALDYGSDLLSTTGVPTANAHLVNKLYADALLVTAKAYTDATAFSSAAGTLPAQAANAGRVLKTDGSAVSWANAIPAATRKTANYTAVAGDVIAADTIATAAWTLTLPASPVAGDLPIRVFDAGSTDSVAGFALNNLSIARNGSTIHGLSQDVTVSTKGVALVIEYINGSWRIRLGS